MIDSNEDYLIEKELVSGLLIQPEDLEDIELEIKWFSAKEFGQIVAAIRKAESYENIAIIESITRNVPSFTISDVTDLAGYTVTGANNQSLAFSIHKRYLRREINKSSLKYAREANAVDLARLNRLSEKFQDLQDETDNGDLVSVVNKFFDEIEKGSTNGLLSYPSIDKALGNGLRNGELMVIGARPSVGKTAFAVNLSMKLLLNENNLWVDFFNLEMSKETMFKRFISRSAAVSSYKLRDTNRMSDNEKKASLESALALSNKDIKIYDKLFYLDQIVGTIKKNVRMNPNKNYVAVIDYLTLIQVKGEKEMRFKVGEITRTLKKLTNDLDIPIILLAQLNRGIENRTGKEKKPKLSDLRESGDIEQDANIVGFLYKPDEAKKDDIYFSIQKNRDGVLADIPFKFYANRMEFSEVYH